MMADASNTESALKFMPALPAPFRQEFFHRGAFPFAKRFQPGLNSGDGTIAVLQHQPAAVIADQDGSPRPKIHGAANAGWKKHAALGVYCGRCSRHAPTLLKAYQNHLNLVNAQLPPPPAPRARPA